MGDMPPMRIGDPDLLAIEPTASGEILEFLAGVRIESRARQWGVFARVSPGVMSWSTGTSYGSIKDFVVEPGAGVNIVRRRAYTFVWNMTIFWRSTRRLQADCATRVSAWVGEATTS